MSKHRKVLTVDNPELFFQYFDKPENKIHLKAIEHKFSKTLFGTKVSINIDPRDECNEPKHPIVMCITSNQVRLTKRYIEDIAISIENHFNGFLQGISINSTKELAKETQV